MDDTNKTPTLNSEGIEIVEGILVTEETESELFQLRTVEGIKEGQDLLHKMLEAATDPTLTKSVIVTSHLTVEDYAKYQNKATILEVRVPFVSTRLLRRQDNDGTKIPCRATEIGYNCAIFKSKRRETFGMAVPGASIFIYGYDIAKDASGGFQTTDIPNPLKEAGRAQVTDQILTQEEFDEQYGALPDTIKEPVLITQDADGKPLEPKVLMIFRPQWGIDQSKQRQTQLKNADMLNLVPNIGVPRKGTTVLKDDEGDSENADAVDEKTARRRKDAIDWNMMPGLQPQIEKPLMNAHATKDQGLMHFLSWIPIASNAPSQKALEAGSGDGTNKELVSPVATTAAALPKDGFDAAPAED